MKRTKWTIGIVVSLALVAMLGTSLWITGEALAARNISVLGSNEGGALQGLFFLKERLAAIHQTLEELNLSDEQHVQLKALREETHTRIEPLIDELIAKHDALHTAVTSGEGEDAIRSAAASVGTSVGDVAVVLSGVLDNLQTILSEEQMATVMKKIETRKEMRHNRIERIRNVIQKIHANF